MGKRCWVSFLLVGCLAAQWIPFGSVAETDDAAAVLINSAGLSVERGFNSRILFPVDYAQPDSQPLTFTWTMQARNGGFGYTYDPDGYDRLYFGGGSDLGSGFGLGIMSHLSQRGYEALDLGLLWRGYEWLSLGANWKNIYTREKDDQELAVGLALRPVGERLTFSCDLTETFPAGGGNGDEWLRVGANAEVMPGVNLLLQYDLDGGDLGIGLNLSYGLGGLESYGTLEKSTGALTDQGLVGINMSREQKHTLFTSRKPYFVEVRFKNGVEDSPSAGAWFGNRLVTLREAVAQLDELAADPRVAGIVLDPQQIAIGLAMTLELRDALVRLQAAGKQIYVFASVLNDGNYALVSLANGIYLNSGGVMLIDGIGAAAGFWKGTLDKIGAEAQYYRRGKYKSAAETYTRESLSEPSREALQAVLDDVNAVYRNLLLDRPGMTDSLLTEVFRHALFSADQAQEYGLIDGAYHPDQREEILSQRYGQKVKLVKAGHWYDRWDYLWEAGRQSRVALIYAEGEILPGKSRPSPFGNSKQIGSATTAAAIRKAREDQSIKAIVLRINSPGGSVLASEDIWREVQRTTHPDSGDAANRKPLYVSMGNMAASGGYYIACAADTIVADSACITGSIGVLAGKISLKGLFEKIGYNLEVLSDQPHVNMFGLHRPFDEEEGAAVQALVDSYYEQFLERVAQGRDLTPAAVDSIAQGRIWSGVAAKKLGLVDEVGGLRETLALVKQRLGLEPDDAISLQIYPGYERSEVEFNLGATSTLLDELESLDQDCRLKLVLDRIALLNSEPALFLLEEMIPIE